MNPGAIVSPEQSRTVQPAGARDVANTGDSVAFNQDRRRNPAPPEPSKTKPFCRRIMGTRRTQLLSRYVNRTRSVAVFSASRSDESVANESERSHDSAGGCYSGTYSGMFPVRRFRASAQDVTGTRKMEASPESELKKPGAGDLRVCTLCRSHELRRLNRTISDKVFSSSLITAPAARIAITYFDCRGCHW